jgi:hypothetical protein
MSSKSPDLKALSGILKRVEGISKEYVSLQSEMKTELNRSLKELEKNNPEKKLFCDDMKNALKSIDKGDIDSAKEILEKNGGHKEV